jgi:NADH-quinone oxidoreductase subunit L
MDWLYDRVFVRPVLWFARVDKSDLIDWAYHGLAALTRASWRLLSYTETGRLRWYAAGIAFGSVLFVAIVLFL